MAKERQETAARIRQAHLAAAASKQKRSESVRHGWIDAAILKRRLSGLIPLLRIRRIRRLRVEEK